MKKLKVGTLFLGAVLSGKHVGASDLWEAMANRLTTLTLYMIMPSHEEILEKVRQEEEKRNQAELTAQAYQRLLIKEQEQEEKKHKKRLAKQEKSRKSQLENTKQQKAATLQERQRKEQENLERMQAIKDKQREDAKKRMLEAKICLKSNVPKPQETTPKKKRSGRTHKSKDLIINMIDNLLEDGDI